MAKSGITRSEVSIYDVARDAGVSPATVSRVFSGSARVGDATRRKVLDAAREHEYVPNMSARSLRAGKTSSVGLLWSQPDLPSVQDTFNQLTQRLHLHGYASLGFQHQHEVGRTIALLQELRGRGVDAIVLHGQPHLVQHPEVREWIGSQPLVIATTEAIDETSADLIVHDRLKAVGDVARHFAKGGRERVGYLLNLRGSELRKAEAFKASAVEAGLSEEGVTLLDYDAGRCDGLCVAVTQRLEQAWEQGQRFDALFCHCDEAAIAAASFFRGRGLSLPDDVALCGFNNIMFADYLDPPLASVDRGDDRLIQAIERLLFRRLETPEAPQAVEHIEMTFEPRASAGRSPNELHANDANPSGHADPEPLRLGQPRAGPDR